MNKPYGWDNAILAGKLHVTEKPFTLRESYETAAWYRDHLVTPGDYLVWAKSNGHGQLMFCAEVDTKITAAYLGSMYGGVAVGPDATGPREIGKLCKYRIVSGASWHPESQAPFCYVNWATFEAIEATETV